MVKRFFVKMSSLLVGASLCYGAISYRAAHSNDPEVLTPADEAQILLRRVDPMGKVSNELPYLDTVFAARVGQACAITRDQLRHYLEKRHINDWEVGGSIDLPVSNISDSMGNTTFAKYFIIHDTSYPRYSSLGSMPSDINEPTWPWNDLNRWTAPVTHIWVNRLGESKTQTPFNEPLSATKYERRVLGDGSARGLYLHVELIQPRASRPGYQRGNDIDAPTPGFTWAQYKQLALLYTIASIRKGQYLIPGFHAAVDEGIKNAHDDPQNFDLYQFFNALKEVWHELEQETPAVSAEAQKKH